MIGRSGWTRWRYKVFRDRLSIVDADETPP